MSSFLRVDLHAHTWFSADSPTSPARLVRQARAAGLDRIAVTDHGTIEGAVAARAIDPELVIVGEEIRCKGGIDLIGLYLHEAVPNGVTVDEAARKIRSQGGVVYAPHPYAYLTRSAERAEEVADVADIIEVFNGRAFYPAWNRRAAGLAKASDVVAAVGSDGHMPWEIGRVFNRVPAFSDGQSLVNALRAADEPVSSTITPLIHVLSIGLQAVRTLLGRPHGVPLRHSARLTERPTD
jgi:predicted metal-dependent phosphoesterase TrpH